MGERQRGFIPQGQRRGGGRGGGRNRGRGGGRGRGRSRGGGRNRGNHFGRGGGGRSSFSNHHTSSFRQQNDDVVNIEEIGIGDSSVRVAVQGCSHGALDNIYGILEAYQEKNDQVIDLLLCCGDFQALRNTTDFDTISVPEKYRDIGSFYKYYAGIKKAPILTIFVGGNHEASSYLQELYYGGWVAPNIYYLGAAGVVRYRGLRIAGISGIFKDHDYRMGRYEFPPYDRSSLRSVYHVRNVDVARLKVLEQLAMSKKTEDDAKSIVSSVDIMLSHDWPRGIEQHGNTTALIRKKRFFLQEIQDNTLGSPANEELMHSLRPKWWFAGHLHVKFQANYHHRGSIMSHGSINSSVPIQGMADTNKDVVQNPNNEEITSETQFIALESSSERCSNANDLTNLMTQFLSLDKCLPRRHHLQIVNVPMPVPMSSYGESSIESVKTGNSENEIDNGKELTSSCNRLCYDLEWLGILQKTHKWTRTTRARYPDPDPQEIQISEEDMEAIRQRLAERTGAIFLSGDSKSDVTDEEASSIDPMSIPLNFSMSLQPHGAIGSEDRVNGGRMVGNSQTDELLHLLDLDHVVTVPYVYKPVVNDISTSKGDGIHDPPKNEDDNEIDLDDDDVDNVEDDNSNDAKIAAKVGTPTPSNTIINDSDTPLAQGSHVTNIAETDSNEIDLDSD